jgi:hypothetical protein
LQRRIAEKKYSTKERITDENDMRRKRRRQEEYARLVPYLVLVGLQDIQYCFELVRYVQLVGVEHHYDHVCSLCKPLYDLCVMRERERGRERERDRERWREIDRDREREREGGREGESW